MRDLVNKKSMFLFGPRSTGKTTLLQKQFSNNAIINLLKSSVYLPLASSPSMLSDLVREIRKDHETVIIDEIQKLPSLLDEVHHLIENDHVKFILTGSSARKLKRSGVNLLGGRAWQCLLHPLVYPEIDDFDLNRYLLYGGLPQVYSSSYPQEELDAYIHTYLKEEIQEEALVQQLVKFSRFFNTVSSTNTEQVNYSNISRDSGIPISTVRSYFSILEDTFTGFLLEPWQGSKKRKAVTTAKWYLFDVGVANYLRGITALSSQSSDFGKAFEHFIAMEIRANLSYQRKKEGMYFWRTHQGKEVDFIIGDHTAIEVKASFSINDKHLKSLRLLKDEGICTKYYVVSLDPNNRTTQDDIQIVHWETFLSRLWNTGL